MFSKPECLWGAFFGGIIILLQSTASIWVAIVPPDSREFQPVLSPLDI